MAYLIFFILLLSKNIEISNHKEVIMKNLLQKEKNPILHKPIIRQDLTYTSLSMSGSSNIQQYGAIYFYRCNFNSIHGNINYGGAIYVNIDPEQTSSTSSIVEDCTFDDCRSFSSGGAIYCNSQISYTFTFRRCNFTNNYVESTDQAHGGSMSLSNANFFLEGCFFDNNYASSKETEYSGCGGAIYCSNANATMTECNFTNNYGISESSPNINCYGGSIIFYEASFEVYDCTFINNTFKSADITFQLLGGSFCGYDSNGEISQCNFIGNGLICKDDSSTQSSLLGGCASFLQSNVIVNDCNFIDSFIESKIEKNIFFGGAVYSLDSNVSFYNCSFDNSSCYSSGVEINGIGGAVSYKDSNGTVELCIFSRNLISLNSQGDDSRIFAGGLHLIQSDVKCNQCKFDGNCLIIEGENSRSYGGAIGIIYSTFDCDDCTFVNNSASTSFTGNDASIANGGCILYEESNGHINNCIFENSSCTINTNSDSIIAYANGAAIFFSKSIIVVNHCSFIRNECSSISPKSNCFGGAIYLQRSIGTFTNCTLKYNKVESSLEESNSLGGAFNSVSSNGTINECFFEQNKVITTGTNTMTKGGAIFFSSSNLTISNSNLINDITLVSGSEIDLEDSDIIIINSNILNDQSSKSDSIHSSSSNLTINGCNISNNEGTLGGNIYYYSNSQYVQLIVDNCNITYTCLVDTTKKSLIYYYNEIESFLANRIMDTHFYINNNNDNHDIFVFEIEHRKVNCLLDRNCIFPYISSYFMYGENTLFYDEKGESLHTFESAFLIDCMLPTSFFSYSSHFSSSSQFSSSSHFSSSSQFSMALKFSHSNHFTASNQFTQLDEIQSNNSPTDQIIIDKTFSMSFSVINVTVRTVVFSYIKFLSNTYVLSYDHQYQSHIYVLTESQFQSYLPYIIYSLSPSYVKTFIIRNIEKPRGLSEENLIGISCGAAALFFVILYIIIFSIQKKRNKFIVSNVSLSISDESQPNADVKEKNVGVDNNLQNNELDIWI